MDFSAYEPLFGMVLPKAGAHTGTTPVHIYGRNFTSAICPELRCRFGEAVSPRAQYISNNHIICEAPDISQSENGNQHWSGILPAEATVAIEIDFGNGFVDTGKTYTYKYDPYVPTTTTTTTSVGDPECNAASSQSKSQTLFAILVLACTRFSC